MLLPDFPSLEINRHPGIEAAVVTIALSILGAVPICMARLILEFDFDRALSLAIAILAVALVHCWHVGWLGKARAIAKITLDADGKWWLLSASGARWEGSLREDSYLVGPLIWLRFDSARGVRQLLRFHGSTAPDAEMLRRLRVRLRLASAVPSPKEVTPLASEAPQLGELHLVLQRIKSLRS